MKLNISKSKNSESYYIAKSYINAKGKSTSENIRKLGTLKELSEKLGTDRDGVIAWCRKEVEKETQKYKAEKEAQSVVVPFNTAKLIEKGDQKQFSVGYLYLQSIYYQLQLDQTCRKIKRKYNFEYDLNAILSDLVYTRVLYPKSKLSSYVAAQKFLEAPKYELHDVYRALSVLAKESDFIQSEVYKNSRFVSKRNDSVLYYDCTNYFFEVNEENELLKYGKSKEHRPNPIVQMGMFMDADGIPLSFSIFPGNSSEITSVKPLEQKIFKDFEHKEFIYCSDAALGYSNVRKLNSVEGRHFIVVQSIKKLSEGEQEKALRTDDFKDLVTRKSVDIAKLSEEELRKENALFYKIIPYTLNDLDHNIIVTYSPKYAAYQKRIRERQVERAEKIVESGGKTPSSTDPNRFVNQVSCDNNGEVATSTTTYLNEEKIIEEAKYDGFYAVSTDLEWDVSDVLKVSEGRWEIEECFRILKSEFKARPVYLQRYDRIEAHFLICFLSLIVFRFFERKLNYKYTCCEILETLRDMLIADVKGQGFVPCYNRTELTDAIHDALMFRTDYEFMTKSFMKSIQKVSKGR